MSDKYGYASNLIRKQSDTGGATDATIIAAAVLAVADAINVNTAAVQANTAAVLAVVDAIENQTHELRRG